MNTKSLLMIILIIYGLPDASGSSIIQRLLNCCRCCWYNGDVLESPSTNPRSSFSIRHDSQFEPIVWRRKPMEEYKYESDSTHRHEDYLVIKRMLGRQTRHDRTGKSEHELDNDTDVSLHHNACLCLTCLKYDRILHNHPRNCRICQEKQADEAAPLHANYHNYGLS